MDENRNKLLELIGELHFDLTEEEALEHVKNLSDQEVNELVALYSQIVSHEHEVEDFVREVHPEEYEKLVDEREENLKKKDEEKFYDLERKQEEEDILLDSEDVKAEREIEEIVKEQESVADLVEGIVGDVEGAAKTAESSKTSVGASSQGAN